MADDFARRYAGWARLDYEPFEPVESCEGRVHSDDGVDFLRDRIVSLATALEVPDRPSGGKFSAKALVQEVDRRVAARNLDAPLDYLPKHRSMSTAIANAALYASACCLAKAVGGAYERTDEEVESLSTMRM